MLLFLLTIGVMLSYHEVEGFLSSPNCFLTNIQRPLSSMNDDWKKHKHILQSTIKESLSGMSFFVKSEISSTSFYFCDETDNNLKSSSPVKVMGFNALNSSEGTVSTSSFSYGDFAKQYPFMNNMAIATTKAGAADFIAQTIIGHTSILDFDVGRSILFMLFGAVYSGGFQWVYQIQIFKRLFDIDSFTKLSMKEKLEDKEGLKTLAMQIALDLTIMTFVYLPMFYIFKAIVFSGSSDPSVWVSTGLSDYVMNFSKDESDSLTVWFPADLVCFSVPLYLRLPVRHAVSFLWTAYMSFSRGGH